ncbi:hypothetical protein CS542_01545 [Pedobacter sp. IW39]|nr:hypothetical protein CS542_01545 [Pedobacter sp. IW39]
MKQAMYMDAHTNTTGKERWTDMLYNINYKHLFNAKGHELTADSDYVLTFLKWISSWIRGSWDAEYVSACIKIQNW